MLRITHLSTYSLIFSRGLFQLEGNIYALAAIVLASLPLISSISNIMLANNLRDLTMDIENHRYTLIYYIDVQRVSASLNFLLCLVMGPLSLAYWQVSIIGRF